MVARYCDHGLYAAPVAAGTVPTAAEDGNGKGKTAATMATLVVTFSGQPTADQAITIAGVTFTAKASGATGNQFNIGATPADTATNLKTAINSSATNAVQPTGSIASTAPLRNIVNACVSGAVVTVYTRIAGSDWNSVTESSTLSNVSVTQWSGGADGAYGYFVSTAAIAWPTSRAIGDYGMFSVNGVYLPPVTGDSLSVRGGKTVSLSLPEAAWTWGGFPASTVEAPFIVTIDDGTEWVGDSSTAVFTVNATYVVGAFTWNKNTAGKSVVVIGKRYSDSSYRLTLNFVCQYGLSMACHGATGVAFVGTSFANNATAQSPGINFVGWYSDLSSTASLYSECKVSTSYNAAPFFGTADINGGRAFVFSDCIISNDGAVLPHTGLLTVCSYWQRYNLLFNSCRFIGFVSGSRLYNTAGNDQRVIGYHLRNCEMGGVSVLGPNISRMTSTDVLDLITGSSQFGYRDFFVDDFFGFVEWNSERSFPYCNAVLLDGSTGWSIHVIPTTVSGRINRFRSVKTPRIGKINSLADGARTLSVELAIHESLTWNKSDISAIIDYIDTDGHRCVIDTYDYAEGALSASSATWNQEVGGKVTYSDGATQYHDKYKFSVTTPTAIATDTEIGIVIHCHSYVPDVTKGFFVDPEIIVT